VSLRFIYDYPVINGTEIDMLAAGPIDEVAVRAEESGFDGFALTDHPVPGARWLSSGGHQALDPFVALGFAAAATTSLRLLTHLAVAPYRNPFILAKAAATVDKLSGGRMILGLGAGYHKTEFFALAVDWKQKIGVTYVNVSSPTRTTAETLDFIEAFGSTYLTVAAPGLPPRGRPNR
jgi:alkanesulfonate monooxygenase SsuD/methylene tetrahydromethanopterin reductase-like flavin-dependent oxidoreductase (luciferase family)